MILVDTGVIADILTKDPDWFEWSSAQIERWADQGPVCFNAIIFAELAVKFDSQKELENRLSAFTHLPMPLNAAFQAGKAFEKYQRAGGKKARPLPDFFIGAHAYVAHLQLLTRAAFGAFFLPCGSSRRKARCDGAPTQALGKRSQCFGAGFI